MEPNFYINMLKKWHVPISRGYPAQDSPAEFGVDVWDKGMPTVGEQLTEAQLKELESLLREFGNVLQKWDS